MLISLFLLVISSAALADTIYVKEGAAGTGTDWCGGADFNTSGEVNLVDFAIISSHWLGGTP